MNFLPKRVILDPDNPLFKKAHPVLLTIFCRGVHATTSKRLMLGAALSMLVWPAGWVVLIVKKIPHLAIVLVVWWVLRAEIATLGVSEYIPLALALLAIFYMELYAELVDLLLYLLVLATGGGFLRWMCDGYLSGTGFRQLQFMAGPMDRLVGTMVAIIPVKYRNQYDEIMDSYLDSNRPSSERRLNEILDQYSRSEAGS